VILIVKKGLDSVTDAATRRTIRAKYLHRKISGGKSKRGITVHRDYADGREKLSLGNYVTLENYQYE
jgi:hypothetical protein